ncbi:hypothetical protein VCHA53O466_50239 [Vibrio chagasii]|nr:hypothetical protein VCHA53O466_50239 [Vibrio chagasii]
MGVSFERVVSSKGVVKHKCVVKVTRNRKVAFRKSKSFTDLTLATEWGDLTLDAAMRDLNSTQQKSVAIKDLISQYLQKKQNVGRSKLSALKKISSSCFALESANTITPADLIKFCKERLSDGVKPQTVNHDLSTIRSVFIEAKTLLNIDLNDDVFRDSLPTLRGEGLICEPNIDNQIVDDGQIEKIKEALKSKENHSSCTTPFTDIVTLMVEHGLKTTTICNLKWSNYDADRGMLVLGGGAPYCSLHINLTVSAREAIEKQPRDGELIFPCEPKSVSEGFGRTCKSIGYKTVMMRHLINTWKSKAKTPVSSQFTSGI